MGSGEPSSARLWDRAPQVANFRIEMISSGGFGRADQKGLHARIDHDPSFFARVKVQRLQTLNQLRDAHLFMEVGRDDRRVLADALVAICGSGGIPRERSADQAPGPLPLSTPWRS